MPITRLEVRNWQSLRHVDLELGDFTVIVGPSSSGKSALIRAFKALASNVRGSDVITRGEKRTAITASLDHRKVTLERTEASGSYQISDQQGSELTFTKLNGGVPDAVTKALGIDPVTTAGASVNFAGQFDRPYLLDDSGATVARVLGELTKVNTIFEAVRTANKVRLNAASTLKTRKSDLQSLRDKIKNYQDLPQKISILDEAEQHAANAAALTNTIERLERATRVLQLAETAATKASQLPTVPSPDAMNNALTRFLDFRAKIRGLAAKTATADTADKNLAAVDNNLAHLEAELHSLMRDAGTCPTCGQQVL